MTNLDNYSIHPAQHSDLPEIVSFLARQYGLEKYKEKLTTLYEWKYFDLVGRETGYPTAFVLRDNFRIAGFIGSMPFILHYKGENFPAGWIADWQLAEHIRGRGMGKRLLSTAIEQIPTLCCIDGSQDAQRVFKSFGFSYWDNGYLWNYIYKTLQYEARRFSGIRKLKSVYRALQHQLHRRKLSNLLTEGDVAIKASSTESLLAIADKIQSQNGLLRNSQYLKWMSRCPIVENRAFEIVYCQEVLGYILLFIDYDNKQRLRGRIVDMKLDEKVLPIVSSVWQIAIEYIHKNHPNLAYLEFITSVATSQKLHLYAKPSKLKRFWLLTDAFSYQHDDTWFISLIDKDNAIRTGLFAP